jgi:hypothetical protein
MEKVSKAMVTTNPLGGGTAKLFLRTCFLTLAAISNGDLLGGLAALGTIGIDLLDDLHAFDDLTEDDVLAVQPLGLGRAHEELRAVRVGSVVRHL